MKNRVHTTLCWILAMSLIWLPVAVSADVSWSFSDREGCHEMNPTISNHDISSHGMFDSGMQTALSEPLAIDNSKEFMQHKGCCDNCDSGCIDCAGMTSCGHSSNHISAFILDKQYSSQPVYIPQSSAKPSVHYHNQIITPDFRPPIV